MTWPAGWLTDQWTSDQMRAAANRAAAMPKFQFNRIKTMKETKPFNLEHAKAGAPYMCRNGQEATIIKWDGRDSGYPLIGVRGSQDKPGSWNVRGAWLQSESEDVYDLVMTPLGHINGKPVFVGDKLVVRGCTNEYIASPCDINALHNLAWPAPPRVYPETKMKFNEMHTVANEAPSGVEHEFRAIANAALRHAIDNGQVITLEDADKSLSEAMAVYRGTKDRCRDARDMEIAKAVRDACMDHVSRFSQDGMLVAALDLKSIIAKVSA